MQSLHQTYHIKAPVSLVWDALVNPKTIEKWGGGSVSMDDMVGTKFSLWDGDIKGTNTKVVHEKELGQDWMAKHWAEPSQVLFKLSEKDGVTTVELTQDNIPDSELKDIDDSWKLYYLTPIKTLLEK